MMTTNISEKSYSVAASYRNFYAGGDLAWSLDGGRLYCLNSTEISVVDVQTSEVVQTFGTTSGDDEVDDDVIYTFSLAPTANDFLVSAHRSGLLRLWSLETGKIVKLWKSQHRGPVVKLQFSTCGQLVCSSGADSTLRMWDFSSSSCISVLKDFQGPVPLVLEFHPNATKTEIYAAGADNAIYCWNYMSKKLVHKLRGHLSQVTAVSFENDTENCRFLASVSRDKVLIIWQLNDGQQYKVVPMYEELEGVSFLQTKSSDEEASSEIVVACAKGNLKLVNCKTAKIASLIDNADYGIKSLLQCKQTRQLAVVTTEQNILIYKISKKNKLKCAKQLIGFNDEILDLCFLGENDRFLAVATNSKNIKIYDTEDNMNCKLIAGHTDTVMTLSTTGDGATSNFLLSAGKDCSIFLWELDSETFDLQCIAKNCSSHTSTIGCIAFGTNSTSIFASVCQDGSLKLWHLQKQDKSKTYSFNIKYSTIAHVKEINCVAFAPNNKMLATVSQDKTAKLWSSETNACIGTLRGHTRGVWCVSFSPVDQIALTSSSDCSLRIWSLTTFACLKRFEQECSILRAEFIDQGKYIAAAASDGLIKIWNIKTNACVHTLDEHSDRVWSLAVSRRSTKCFYSGGADSKLIKWNDCTVQRRNEEKDQLQAVLQQEQMLQSLLHQKHHMQKAFLLALKLGKPRVTYNVVSHYIRNRQTSAIKDVICTQLNDDQRSTLISHVKAWSTNSRHCKVSNLILRYILSDVIANPSERLYNTSHLVEVIAPYVQRHFKRVNELNKDLAFLEFIVKCM